MFIKICCALFFVAISVNGFPIDLDNNIVAGDERNLQFNRLKRENHETGQKSYVRAFHPNIMVMPGVPNSYGRGPSSYNDVGRGGQTVVVMTNDAYPPFAANPYARY